MCIVTREGEVNGTYNAALQDPINNRHFMLSEFYFFAQFKYSSMLYCIRKSYCMVHLQRIYSELKLYGNHAKNTGMLSDFPAIHQF